MSIDFERLNQCEELNYILVGDLLDLLDEPPNAQTSHWLSAVLDQLLETLPEEYSLKADEGYLSDVVASFPNWETNVEQLEEQNFQLIRRLRIMRRVLDSGVSYQSVARELQSDLQAWILALRKHRHDERYLVQMAYNLVIGGSG